MERIALYGNLEMVSLRSAVPQANACAYHPECAEGNGDR